MTPNTNTTDRKPMIIIIVLVVLAAIVLLPRLLNNNTSSTVIPTNVPAQQNPQTNESNIQLGAPVSARSVDSNGCATESQSTFFGNDSIYVVAPDSNIAQGTSLFVRLYRDSEVIEDAPAITADRDYTNNCINFVFQPTGAAFEVGNYEAQFFVNGNPGPSVVFNVQ